ncbi:hypothetical protein IQ07DRAFT_675113 [Pyrenochaeta sp. DS3sAY3a]|nr:hypothetical protein IQ07DRAFT_675113 [Pyrenochaeta sp. DS3sAY3a]
MKSFGILLSLATGVTAIDVRIWRDDNLYCTYGYWEGCLNLNPNVCCALGTVGQSISFENIPTNWNLELRAYALGTCDEANRYTWYHRPGWLATQCDTFRAGSAGYGFIGSRAARGVTDQECEKPNAAGLADGTRYNLTAMSEDRVNEFRGHMDALRAADLPELFKEYEF